MALRTLLARIKHLTVKSIDSFYQWHPILSLANPHLSSLVLEDLSFTTEELTDSVFSLLEIELQRFTTLSSFSVIRTPTFVTLLEVSENPKRRLRHLKLEVDNLADPYVRFISSFANLLAILEVETDDDFRQETGPPILSQPMPHLTSLTVTDTSEAYGASPAELTPSLRHLILRSSPPYTSTLASFVPGRVQKLPKLVSLTFSPRDPEHPILSHQHASKLAEIPNLRTYFDRRGFNPMLAYRAELDTLSETSEYVEDLEYIRRRHGPIEEVIRFGARYNEQLLNTRDQSGMDQLVEALRPLKLLQDFQED